LVPGVFALDLGADLVGLAVGVVSCSASAALLAWAVLGVAEVLGVLRAGVAALPLAAPDLGVFVLLLRGAAAVALPASLKVLRTGVAACAGADAGACVLVGCAVDSSSGAPSSSPLGSRGGTGVLATGVFTVEVFGVLGAGVFGEALFVASSCCLISSATGIFVLAGVLGVGDVG